MCNQFEIPPLAAEIQLHRLYYVIVTIIILSCRPAIFTSKNICSQTLRVLKRSMIYTSIHVKSHLHIAFNQKTLQVRESAYESNRDERRFNARLCKSILLYCYNDFFKTRIKVIRENTCKIGLKTPPSNRNLDLHCNQF